MTKHPGLRKAGQDVHASGGVLVRSAHVSDVVPGSLHGFEGRCLIATFTTTSRSQNRFHDVVLYAEVEDDGGNVTDAGYKLIGTPKWMEFTGEYWWRCSCAKYTQTASDWYSAVNRGRHPPEHYPHCLRLRPETRTCTKFSVCPAICCHTVACALRLEEDMESAYYLGRQLQIPPERFQRPAKGTNKITDREALSSASPQGRL